MTDAEILKKIKDEVSFEGWLVGYLEKKDFEWLIEQAEKVGELERRFEGQIQSNYCIVCGDNATDVRQGAYYCEDCCR